MWFFSILARDNTIPRTVFFTPEIDFNPVPCTIPETDEEINAFREEFLKNEKLTLLNHEFWTEKVCNDKDSGYALYLPARVVKTITRSDFQAESDRITQMREPNGTIWFRHGETFSPNNTIELSKYGWGRFIEAVYFTDEIPEKVTLINSAGAQMEYELETDGNPYLFLGMRPNNNLSQYSNLYMKFDKPYNFNIIYVDYIGPTDKIIELFHHTTFKWGKYGQCKYFWYNINGIVYLGVDEDDNYSCYKRLTEEGWINVATQPSSEGVVTLLASEE